MQMIRMGQSPIPDRRNQNKPSQPQPSQKPLVGGQLVVFGATALRFDPAVGLRLGMVHAAILPGGPLGELRIAYGP